MVETTESVWVLAHYAGVTAPDSETSPGAEFLLRVARSCQETVKWASENGEDITEEWVLEAASEVTDRAVPIYTHNLWATFVDLSAYDQADEVRDMGYDTLDLDDVHKLPTLCLFVIAERLAQTLLAPVEDDD